MPFIATQDGTDLYYKDWGTGMPVVLIHGWPLNADMWEYQAPFLLDQGYRVISYDRRGFGRSDQPGTGYDYNTLASDLNDLMTELELSNAALVGFSMGGGEVARYIANYGTSRVSKAVFMSAVTPYLLKTEDNPDGVDQSTFEDIADNLKKDRAAFLATFGKQFYGSTMVHHTVSSEFLEWSGDMALMASPVATMKCMRSWSQTDFRADLRQVTVPALVIHGTGDGTVPIDVSGRKTVKLLPNARLLEYDGAPHGLFATVPDQLNADLLNFLGGPQNTVPTFTTV